MHKKASKTKTFQHAHELTQENVCSYVEKCLVTYLKKINQWDKPL